MSESVVTALRIIGLIINFLEIKSSESGDHCDYLMHDLLVLAEKYDLLGEEDFQSRNSGADRAAQADTAAGSTGYQ